MPAMLRTSKKAKRIAYDILGKPANFVYKRPQTYSNDKLVRQENSRLR